MTRSSPTTSPPSKAARRKRTGNRRGLAASCLSLSWGFWPPLPSLPVRGREAMVDSTGARERYAGREDELAQPTFSSPSLSLHPSSGRRARSQGQDRKSETGIGWLTSASSNAGCKTRKRASGPSSPYWRDWLGGAPEVKGKKTEPCFLLARLPFPKVFYLAYRRV